MEARGAAAATVVRAPGPGEVLGKFTLLEPIGEGGMARLYLARAAGLGGFEKRVVVKQILPRLAEDAEFIARFIQEARLAATLSHPNIAAVYEVDVQDGIYFYSMEYVRGRDLQQVTRRAGGRQRRLEVAEVVAIVSALCAGLHHAHTKRDADGAPLGIVHRDISPSNVLVGFEGAVKLTDFGVAKARTGTVATEAGMLRGKIPYMSPEQCRGEAIDRRSDVYAVGVLMWELLTGRRLHTADTEIAILRRIAEVDAPSPRSLRADCPAELERIVMRALHRSAAERYQSAGGLQEELEELARQQRLGVAASTVARLMEELFGEEVAAAEAGPRGAVAKGDGPATATAAIVGAPPIGGAPTIVEAGSATATMAPGGAARAGSAGSPAARRIDEQQFEDAPTRAVAVEAEREVEPKSSRRSWAGVGVGLALGVLLGGGGLYFASRSPEGVEAGAAGATGRSPGAAEASTEERTPAAGAGSGAAATLEPAADPVAPTPAVELEDPRVEPEAKQESRPPRRNKPRRRRKPRRDDGPTKLNLDSPMPPGLDGG